MDILNSACTVVLWKSNTHYFPTWSGIRKLSIDSPCELFLVTRTEVTATIMYFKSPCAQRWATRGKLTSITGKTPVALFWYRDDVCSVPWNYPTCRGHVFSSQLYQGQILPSSLYPVIGSWWTLIISLLPVWFSGIPFFVTFMLPSDKQ